MKFLNKIKRRLSIRLFPLKETDPEQAYNMWSNSYDDQPDNLMLALDEVLFSSLIGELPFTNKTIVDVGCGTGRHWKKIYEKYPSTLIGYDVSEGMLNVLQQKFPQAQTRLLKNSRLHDMAENSCDLLISTLALAHIANIEEAFNEWSRVLKPNGQIIITDYHPAMFLKGGDRTFKYEGKKIAVKNYLHSLEKIRTIAFGLRLKEQNFFERKIDEGVKSYYEKKNALTVYERFKGTPVIYGIRLIKEK